MNLTISGSLSKKHSACVTRSLIFTALSFNWFRRLIAFFTLPSITAVVSIDWLVVSGSPIGGKMDIGGATVVTSSVDSVVGTTNTIFNKIKFYQF